jgi:hypothetical protein
MIETGIAPTTDQGREKSPTKGIMSGTLETTGIAAISSGVRPSQHVTPVTITPVLPGSNLAR